MDACEEYPRGRCRAPGVHMGDAQYDEMCDEIDRLHKALGEQTEAVRKWRNRAHSIRAKLKKVRETQEAKA